MEHATPAVSSRQPKRATSACEACRALKVKCIKPGEGQPCTKCARSNSQCVFPEPKQRARVSQRAKPRLVDLESKLTSIIGLLSRSDQSSPSYGEARSSVETGPTLPATLDKSSSSSFYDPVAKLVNQGHLDFPELGESPELSGSQGIFENTLQKSSDASATIDAAWVTDLGLSAVVLDYLLDKFRGMASYFPFVQLSETWTAVSMAEGRPFLLLAAVAAASSEFHLQDALVRQFKESLSKRVVVAGEKDLDLLQGLLVHLAWFQFHFIPGSQQDCLYTQMAISMVIDLHLDQEAGDLLEQPIELGNTYIREACRAYLGCYYMSRIITMSSGRPNNLQYHKNMIPCAMMLQQQPEFKTDLLIYPVMKVLQFTEEVCETYTSEGLYGPRLYIHAERFMTRLEDWRSSLSAELRSTVLLSNAYHIAKIRIQEMGLVYRYGKRKHPIPEMQDSTLLSMPPMVITNLIKCVSSTKESLDSFLALPVTAHSRLPFAMWYQVILSIFVLYRLSIGLPEAREWNVEIAQQTVDLQAYFDTLLSYLQITKPSPDQRLPTKSLYSRFHEIMESVRTSYAVARGNVTEVHDSRNVHQQLKYLNNTAQSGQRLHRCPALRYSSRNAAQLPSQPPLPNAIAMEVHRIEDERLWGDLLVMEDPGII